MKQTILHENSHGIKMIRTDYVNRSKVTVGTERHSIHTYRFNNLKETFNSPYISWANLDCCNGWRYDECYLLTAVQQGKKLYAGTGHWLSSEYSSNHSKTLEEALCELKEIERSLPEGVMCGVEKIWPDGRRINTFICREGKLSDYYNLNEVFNFYAKLGMPLTHDQKNYIKKLCSYEIYNFSKKIPLDYANPVTDEEYIVVGLLLGYPLESTCSLLQE